MIARYHASTRVSCGGKQQREEETPSQVRAACTSMSFDEMRSTSHLARCPLPDRALAGPWARGRREGCALASAHHTVLGVHVARG